MSSLGLVSQDRPVVEPALEVERRTGAPAAAIQRQTGES